MPVLLERIWAHLQVDPVLGILGTWLLVEVRRLSKRVLAVENKGQTVEKMLVSMHQYVERVEHMLEEN